MPPTAFDPRAGTGLLWLLAALLALHALVLAFWRVRLRERTGPEVLVVRRRAGVRWALLGGVAAVAAAVLLAGEAFPRGPALAVLALAALGIAAAPGFQDSVIGELGVRRGWHARRFGELEEWRLIGDHLRWRLHGVWVASDWPAPRHDELRPKLDPARESRFRQ